MHHIYCISGLGADYRIFQKLQVKDAEMHFIHWEMPGANDTMRSYALKLAKQIKHSEIILIGMSYGGMLATEISSHFNNTGDGKDPGGFTIKKTILVSSCKCRDEFPGLLTLAGRMRIHRAVPYRLVLRNNFLNRFVFDPDSNKAELQLKRTMLKDLQVNFIRRSLNMIMNWKNVPAAGVVHIHGTRDKLLTPKNVKADFWIDGGGHFMVWNRAADISRIISQIIH